MSQPEWKDKGTIVERGTQPPEKWDCRDKVIPGNRFRIDRIVYRGSQFVVRGEDDNDGSGESKELIFILHKEAIQRTGTSHSDSRFVVDLTADGNEAWKPFVCVEVIRLGCELLLTESPGEKPRQYKILDFLGMGGFGEVWKAKEIDRPNARSLGIKAIKFLKHKEANALGVAEAVNNSRLSEVRDLRGMPDFAIGFDGEFTLDETLNRGWPRSCLIMELAGATLEDVIKHYYLANRDRPKSTTEQRTEQSRSPASLARHLCEQLIDAVAALHWCDFVHGDLKERNVLLVFPGSEMWDLTSEHLRKAKVVLGDFDTLTRRGDIHEKSIGQTLEGHRAPELMQTDVDGAPTNLRKANTNAWPAEDCFALGVIFERLANAFAGVDQKDLLDVARRLCATNPEDRPKLERALKFELWPDLRALYPLLRHAGWRSPEPGYERFHGRKWVREKFEIFCRRQRDKQQGGLFLVIGEVGIGKTALLTHWTSLPNLGASTDTTAPCSHQGSRLRPAFFFRHRDRDQTVAALQSQIVRQLLTLTDRLKLNDGESIDSIPINRFADLLRAAAETLPDDEVLTVVIDAVDESEDPQEVVKFLRSLCSGESAVGLPSRVFLVVAACPRVQEQPLLEQLSNLGPFVSAVELKAYGPENAEDAREFWVGECRQMLPKDIVELACCEAPRAVEVAGGMLLVLRSAIDDIKSSKDSPEAKQKLKLFLEGQPFEGLNGWYSRQWKRLLDTHTTHSETRAKVEHLARLMSAVREPVPLRLLARWLAAVQKPSLAASQPSLVDIDNIQKLLHSMKWLLTEIRAMGTDHNAAAWYPKHLSAVTFLESEQGPASGWRTAIHKELANAILRYAPGGSEVQAPDWACRDDYEIRHVVTHLLEASTAEDGLEYYRVALRLLTEQRYLDIRLNLGS